MNSYQRYRQARDLAWQVLIRLKICRLPVDMRQAAQSLGISVLDMPDQDAGTLGAILAQLGNAPCKSLQIKGKWHIFLRPGALDDQRSHFAIAHELGHILLRHETRALSPGIRAPLSRANPGDLAAEPDSPWDYEADLFAVRLLAPACVLHGLDAHTPSRLISLAGLPPQAAQIRAERMGLLNTRNAYFSHPLERQVYQQFLPYIQGVQAPDSPPVYIGKEASLAVSAPAPRKKTPVWLVLAGAAVLLAALIACFLTAG